jgi:hypothetical protein
MDIRRGEPPASVERQLIVDINAEEVLTILTNYIKKRMNTDRIRIDGIEATLSNDTSKLMTMTITGAEIIPITWNLPSSSSGGSSPTPAPIETK